MPKLKAPSVKLFFALLLLFSTAIRIVLSVFTKSAVTYADELMYLELSQNIWLRGSLTVYNAPVTFSKLLYPLLLSPFYAVSDSILRTKLISAFNAVLISSSLIPGYLLAKSILKKNSQIIFALLFLALSPNLLFSVTFMAENLFYPLLLWGFWAVYKYLKVSDRRGARGGDRKAPSILGLIAFLLYFTKESGAAFVIALLLLLLAKRQYKPLGLYTAGFLVPFLVLRILILGNTGYSYAEQASLANLSDAAHLMYFLYTSVIALFWFLLSSLWFPVALPFFRRKSLSAENRSLLSLSVLYVVILSVGVAFGVSLGEGFPSVTPRVHLRYFLGAVYPFLLLFLSSFEHPEPFSLKSSFSKATLAFAVVFLLFFYLPQRGSLVDYPVLHFADYINAYSWKWLWLVRLAVLGGLVGFILLWNKGKQKMILCILLPFILIFELAGGAAFYRTARREEKVSDESRLAEVRLLDHTLDSLEGNVLVVTPDLSDPDLKLLDTLSTHTYALALTSSFREEAQPQTPETLPVPADKILSKFYSQKTYGLTSVDYIVTVADWDLLDTSKCKEITPAGLGAFRIWQVIDPSRLPVLDPLSYIPGTEITFRGSSPTFKYYEPEGFSPTEYFYTWSQEGEVSLTLKPQMAEPGPLTARWTWHFINGEQSCEIYANDILVCQEKFSEDFGECVFTIPPETWSETGILKLRFVFPDARHPENGDSRSLAFAFTTLTLNP